jgi:hypothetical protein
VDTEYYDRSLERARKTLDELDGISREECEERAVAAHKKALAEWQDRESRREIENGRYAAMREKVLAWNPPSDDHLEMKNFMLQQIEKSFDNYKNDPPTPMTGAEWLGEQVRHAQHNIEYQTKARADEIKRVEGRNRWVRLLRESLG